MDIQFFIVLVYLAGVAAVVLITVMDVFIKWDVYGPDKARESLRGFPIAAVWPIALVVYVVYGIIALLALTFRLDPQTRRSRSGGLR